MREKENIVETKFFFGSIFKLDKNNISYSNEILGKIKDQMRTNNILILKDLESVYPALYELFNQSYTYLEGKKFVYLGYSRSLTLVNDNFKVIVLLRRRGRRIKKLVAEEHVAARVARQAQFGEHDRGDAVLRGVLCEPHEFLRVRRRITQMEVRRRCGNSVESFHCSLFSTEG